MDKQIFKPETIPDAKSVDFDICIVGSGCGGSITADRLSQKGHSVIILEEGPYMDKTDFNQDASKLVPKMYRRSAGLATDDMSIRFLSGRVYGGTSTINWMTCLRTPDFVLEQWVKEFGLEEFSPSAMKKHFETVEKRLSVHKINDEDHSPNNRIILDGCRKLGIHGEASSNNSIDCVGCGACGLGCYYDAKQDMRLTYLKDALDNGITVYTGTSANKIDYINKNQQIVNATILGSEYGLSNREISINCKRVILAASALYTPLLLQNSGLTKGGVVGKYLTIHPVTAATGAFDQIIDPTYGIPQSTFAEEYLDYDGNGYGWWLEVPDLEPFLIGINYAGIGSQRREDIKNMRNFGTIIIIVRDGANKKSNGEVRWRRGINFQNGHISWKKIPSIRYRLCKQDKNHLLKGLENAMEVLFASGAIEVGTGYTQRLALTSPDQIPSIRKQKFGPNRLFMFSAHPMGTARMGKDSGSSVVNEKMEMHHYPGVYVMDGSTLPTAPGVNPMITILSMVSRAHELGSIDL